MPMIEMSESLKSKALKLLGELKAILSSEDVDLEEFVEQYGMEQESPQAEAAEMEDEENEEKEGSGMSGSYEEDDDENKKAKKAMLIAIMKKKLA